MSLMLIMEDEYLDLSFVQNQFLCCTPVNRFNWKNSDAGTKIGLDAMSPRIQKQILEKTVNHDLVRNYPIKRSYQRAFVKLLINELEKNCQEIDDDMYGTYCSLVSTDDEQSLTHYRHFVYDKNESTADVITLQESVNIVSLGTTGLCTWQRQSSARSFSSQYIVNYMKQAGLVLAEWCMTNKDFITGKKILELGCGVGLTGLAIVRSCAPKEYVFSDIHPSVLEMLRKNIKINLKSDDERISNLDSGDADADLRIHHNGANVEAVRLPWEEINDSLNAINPDVVLAADVLYDDSCFDSLAAALRYLLKNNGTYAVVAATVRNAETIEQFSAILGSHDLIFEELKLPVRKFFIHTDDTPVRILKIVNVGG